ncbi:MAG: hypothetical protein AAB671_01900 [Patescibacteria group bacterium]
MAASADHGTHQTKETHPSCCSLEDSGASVLVHSQLQSALPSAYVLLIAFFIVAASFLFARVRACVSPPYTGRPERRYGGTRLFSKYAELFSQGILHPKTF